MVIHDKTWHTIQQLQRKSGTGVHVYHMKRYNFYRCESKILWKKWLPSEFSNYQNKGRPIMGFSEILPTLLVAHQTKIWFSHNCQYKNDHFSYKRDSCPQIQFIFTLSCCRILSGGGGPKSWRSLNEQPNHWNLDLWLSGSSSNLSKDGLNSSWKDASWWRIKVRIKQEWTTIRVIGSSLPTKSKMGISW